MDFIDHPKGSNADAPSGSSGQLFASVGAGCFGERLNGADNARMMLTVYFCELLLSPPQDVNSIGHAS